MSNELTIDEITQALAAIDAAWNAADVAQDQAVKLRGHIDWLEEQLAERAERIESLEQQIDEANERIEALQLGD